MEFLLPAILGVSALVFILMPFWGGATKTGSKARAEAVLTRANLDLDRELGKVDEDEWRELRPATLATETAHERGLEALIAAFRRARRVDLALESEILIARARRQGRQRMKDEG